MQLRKRWHNRIELSLQGPSRGVWGCSEGPDGRDIPPFAALLYVPRTSPYWSSRKSTYEMLHTCCSNGNRCRNRLSPGPIGHAPCYPPG